VRGPAYGDARKLPSLPGGLAVKKIEAFSRHEVFEPEIAAAAGSHE
jgi:hypothetical protein